MPTIKKFVPRQGHYVHFTPRATMRRRKPQATAQLPPAQLGVFAPPLTALPVDCTGNAKVNCPMDGNDSLGDCMEAMACHVDGIWTFGRGQAGWKESSFSLSALEAQYKQASGGDNGLDEPTLLDQCWKPGLAGVAAATYVDSLNVEVTDIPLAQYLIDQLFHICMMWSVPDAFVQNFAEGTVWAKAGIPDPQNGHGTPLADIGGANDTGPDGISLAGFYRLWTWGTWCWVSPEFIASVDPECFVVFSARQFNPATGYDSHGRHITTQAAVWQSIGGKPIPISVIAAFPPISGPVPPSPVPPTPPVPPSPPIPPSPPPLPPVSVIAIVDAEFAMFEAVYARNRSLVMLLRVLNARIDQALESQGFHEVSHARALDVTGILNWIDQEMAKALPIMRPILAQAIIAYINTLGWNPAQVAVVDALINTYIGGKTA